MTESTEELHRQGSSSTSTTLSSKKDISIFTQTRILAHKNWIQKRRTEFTKLITELLLPVLYLVILSFLVKLNKRTVYPEVTVEYEKPQDVLNSLDDGGYGPHWIYMVHSNLTKGEEMAELMKLVWNNTRPKKRAENVIQFKLLRTVDELLDLYASSSDVQLAIVLGEMDDYSYTIRINPDGVNAPPMPSTKTQGLETCRGLSSKIDGLEATSTCPVNGYYYSNFLALQHLIDSALIMKTGGDKLFKALSVSLENYPKQAYTPGMPTVMRILIPLYCIIPLAQLINTLLILVVTEKEDKIKDGLKMIGVSDTAYWASWFVIYGAMSIIFAVMFTLVMHYMAVLQNINVVVLFLLFTLFGFSIITFAFSLTPFFHKPKTAGAVGTVIMQFTGTLFMLQTFIVDPSSPVIMPLRLISSVAFTTALDVACQYEYGTGVALSDLMPGEKASGILYSLLFLAFDTIFYGVVAIYLDNVIPNEYGVRKHPLYFLNPSFWCNITDKQHETVLQHDDEMEGIEEIHSDDIENVHSSLVGKEAFRIRNLRKTFTNYMTKENVEAVKGISLDIYENQITALLGRNGAGKSTTISMMTGLVMPTGGRCVAFGLDVEKPVHMMKLRKMTGVCMQQDLHFSSLTTKEHLKFYGKLRGVRSHELEVEIEELLQELELLQQKDVAAAKLSGGQKRKLSVAIALIGSPKIILLDEPSSSVDPVSRRQLWALLQKKKMGRVIILTTHFMDEADILADRKAIIHNGNLKCMGSSLFLKRRFGVGYQLTVELDETQVIRTDETDAIIRKWIPDAEKSRRLIANEIKYTLPHSEVARFPNLFEEFENVIGDATSSVRSYGVSMTTLSEVFLKISNDMDMGFSDPKLVASLPHRRMSSVSAHSQEYQLGSPIPDSPVGDNLIPEFGDCKPDIFTVFFALCVLRIRRLIRSPQSVFFMLILPTLFLIGGFALIKTQTTGASLDSLTIKYGSYHSIYAGQELAFALSKDSSPGFTSFVSFSATTVPYSGQFSDLLNTTKAGTTCAFQVDDVKQVAHIRINGTYLHSPGMALNAINQYFLRTNTNSSTNISTTSQPLPSKNKSKLDQSSFYAVFLVGPVFTFPAVGMVMEVVNDREKQTRNHLRVNGVSFWLYFSSIFFVYGALSMFITVMQVLVIYIFGVTAFTNPFAITVVVCLLLLFIFPCLLFSAAFSYLFDRMETAQSVFSQVCSWMGYIMGLAVIFIDLLAPDYALLVHVIFSFVDVFYIPFGIFYNVQKQYIYCSLLNNCDDLSFKSYTGTEFWVMAVAMIIQIPVFGLWLLAADVYKNGGSFRSILTYFSLVSTRSSRPCVTPSQLPSGISPSMVEDEDVQQESSRVDDYFRSPEPNDKCVVAMQDLQKWYQVKRTKDETARPKYFNKKVLHGISLMVEEGEVFGLLGHNGAGKTTTLKLLTGEESPDAGKIKLCGYDISSNLSEAFQKLGYCPQHDALWDNITLREHIELYAIIRGVKPVDRKDLVDHFLRGLQIEEHSKKKSNILSGGTKRKLSYCMSILGAPQICLLDEPSTGMDIVSKRFLWNTVIGTFTNDRGAILTTHSMEEADALCSRIGIMNKGSLLCIGSPQHLKSKFGVGYNLEIKLKMDHEHPSPSKDKFSFILRYIPEAKLAEMFENRAVFSIPKTGITSIAQTFSLLEQIKIDQSIEEYSFSQTTLEQVFLHFATSDEPSIEESLSSTS